MIYHGQKHRIACLYHVFTIRLLLREIGNTFSFLECYACCSYKP